MVSIDGRLLALFGLDSDRDADLLAPLGLDEDATTRVLEHLARGAHPPTALRTVLDLAEGAADDWRRLAGSDDQLRRLAVLAGASDTLAELVVRAPEARAVLTGDLAAWSTDDVRERADAAVTDGGAQALVDLQRCGALRIALRDLLGMADTPTAAAELSQLADGIIAAAHAHVARPDAPIAVIAMGKLGGRELNYVSDVDLLFVADDANAAAGVARALFDLLGAVTPSGRVYEIDTNLRPEGRDGPLVRSLDAYRAYYERWARTWEFQALLKARPIAGDHDLGARFRTAIEPFVWPEQLGDGAVAEIQKMKGVVERSAPVRAAGARQLKLAPGGLRDIEFAVQLLQLVHGRADDSLRSPNTLEGLSALAAGGYVDDGDANLFSDAYQFLRTVEHRLQVRRMRRIHVVPSAVDERRRLARAVGFRDIRAADALTQFDREFSRVQGYVRRLHEKLFYRPLLTRFGELTAREQRQLGGGLDETAARERLAVLGFAAPDRAVAHIDALVGGTTRLARVLRTTLPAVLPALASAPDPDGGLTELRSLCERLVHNPTLLQTLRDAPPSGELLVALLGRSRLIGEWLVRDPDLIANLSDPSLLDEDFDIDTLDTQLDALLRRSGDPQQRATAVGRRLRRELVWTAIRDLSGRADVESVTDHLTGVAEVVLEVATRLALTAADVRLAVIGLGRLGAGELGYASDLDVLVVFDPPDARDEALAAVERMLSLVAIIAPSAPAFTLDLNLRPEGKAGPLARSMESYERYYERWAQSWEFLALTQARVVAGERALGARWLAMVADHVFQTPASQQRLSDVRSMKARVEQERARTRGGAIDLKLGAGGLSDIEWTVQLLALAHGGAQAQLREPGTRAGLAAAAAAGLIDDRQHGWLLHGWRTLTRLRNVLYLMGERNSHVLRDKGEIRAHAAQMLGHEPPGVQRLEEELRRAMRRVRTVHEQVFY
ncbi:MAG: bifunctional [glutamine synthetase] adenylyltransferase/[glutamine synthetase]-adenylyl-L-tyrosine phosphorylase [Actinobacteria bacterium]|nr:bifunctional [glutamine synthetase] adenylyltransferase/[glutamine synthetase]-adenylyl-L-tyrosine phosphorylase [Actinomycetota bacterium]